MGIVIKEQIIIYQYTITR